MKYKFNSAALKRALYQNGFTNKAFAQHAGIGIMTLQYLLNGSRIPTAPIAKKVSDALGLEVTDLMEIEEIEHETA